jgi:RNA polymerase sigma-70 factor (ECF subfamily)
VRQDPPDLFSSAFLAAAPSLRRVASGLGFAAPDVDDILQRVFLTLQQRPPEWRSAEAAEHWLYRTTVNACRSEYRERARFRQIARGRTEDTPEPQSPANAAEQREQRECVRQALLELDGDLAVPLVLRYFCDWDATRIGSLLELPASTIRARLRRARLRLADQLSE